MRLWTRLSIAMTALVLMTAGAIAAITYRDIAATSVPRALAGLAVGVQQLFYPLETVVRTARNDLLVYATQPSLRDMVSAEGAIAGRPADPAQFQVWRERVARWYVAALREKAEYTQLRVIGLADGGREVLRVDRSTGQIRVYPDTELQRKAERPYFQDAIKLPAHSVGVSTIELNQEYGKVENPPMPVIHVSTPLHDHAGNLFGILVVNIDLRNILSRIREASDPGAMHYLVNATGDFLVHPDSAQEFGFDLGRRHRIQDEFPGLTPAEKYGSVEGLFRNSDDEEFGLAALTLEIGGGPVVTMIKAQRYEDLVGAIRPLRSAIIAAGILGALAAIAVAVVMARSLTRPISRMTKSVESIFQGAPLNLDTGAAGEIGVLARAFKQMADQVTDRTEALRKNAELLDKTIASIADAVLVIDREGQIVFANPACRKLFGDRDDLGQPSWQRDYLRFKPDGVTPLPPGEAPIGRAVAGQSFDALEVVMREAGQAENHIILASGRPILDPRGRQEGAVIVYREVTEARAAERRLRQAQQLEAVGQLTGGVAHDFNNILTVIVGMSAVLAEDLADRPKSLEALGLIERAAQRGADLTRTLLAVARRQALEPRKTDVNALATEATKLLRATLTEAVAFELMLAKDLAPVLIDPAQLTTAILNLALNARDAMPDGGKLTIETGAAVLDEDYARLNPGAAPGRYVMVAVSDTGAGMSPAVLEKVFQPFFTTKEQGHGTGLGLSMVYGFIKQSHGHVKIYSELGYGTTVKMYLPLADPAAPDEPAPDAPLSAAARQGETVLVVEDDELVRRSVIGQLESLGYKVIEAANGADALAVDDRGERFDLLFTDVIMPGGMNGRQLAEAMAARRPGLKVLYTSGYTENAIVHHGRLDPGVHLLNKPYRKADLARMLREVLDGPAP